MPHGLKSIFISGGSEIGKNCVIYQQVTIGGNSLIDSSSNGSPIIGDNCFIGAGAIVVEDIPLNSLVVAEKPKIIKKDYIMDNRFVTYINGKKSIGKMVYIKNWRANIVYLKFVLHETYGYCGRSYTSISLYK